MLNTRITIEFAEKIDDTSENCQMHSSELTGANSLDDALAAHICDALIGIMFDQQRAERILLMSLEQMKERCE